MDFATVASEILHVKKETIIDIAKKAALPFTLIPIVWMIFFRKTGIPGKSKVVSKPILKAAAADDDVTKEGCVLYNLRNLVRFIIVVKRYKYWVSQGLDRWSHEPPPPPPYLIQETPSASPTIFNLIA